LASLKFMKVDVLGLGMLGCMHRAFDLRAKSKNIRLDLATIPAEDLATYAMIRKADTVGTFQIESRAQMSMLWASRRSARQCEGLLGRHLPGYPLFRKGVGMVMGRMPSSLSGALDKW
jgi:hypothetical protein